MKRALSSLHLSLLFFAGCTEIAGIERGLEPKDPACAGLAEGAAIALQVGGDCALAVCNGAGNVELAEAPDDVPDDGDPCTRDLCDGTFPWHEALEWAPCYSGPEGSAEKGACRAGVYDCSGPPPPMGACFGERLPASEFCDGAEVDEDCDGEIDEEGLGCFCGDGQVQMSAGETCDDGNSDFNDACTPLCRTPSCGDGYLQRVLGEQCEDGNTQDGDGCPGDCRHPLTLVAAGNPATCAVFADGPLKCWGSNGTGELGLGDNNNRGANPGEMGQALPFVDLGKNARALSAAVGFSHACALLEGGGVKCWGYNGVGELGLGDTVTRGKTGGDMGDHLPAVDLGAGAAAKAIAAGASTTCAVLEGGALKCWGFNYVGQLGLGDIVNRGDTSGTMGADLPAIDLGAGQSAKAVSAGEHHICVLLASGAVKCWGQNNFGELGLGDSVNRGGSTGEMGDALPAVDLGLGQTAIAVATGYGHTCALLASGAVKCWGKNDVGQLGLGDKASRGDGPGEMGDALPAVDLGPGQSATAITSGSHHTCARLASGAVKCWGGNDLGQAGFGDPLTRGDGPGEMGDALLPIDLGAGLSALGIRAGSVHTCAWLSTGAVKCWGWNQNGELGLGDTVQRGKFPTEMGDALPAVELF